MGRAPCCEKVGLKKGRWTAEEDEILMKYIQANGEGHWRSLPKNAGLLRCGKSCRLRWINYLRGDLKRGNISAEEEDKIIKLHSSLGNRWSLIAAHFPGRTDNEIKNYWNSRLSRRIVCIRKAGNEGQPPVVMDIAKLGTGCKRRGGRTARSAMKKKPIKIINGANSINAASSMSVAEKKTMRLVAHKERDVLQIDGGRDQNGSMGMSMKPSCEVGFGGGGGWVETELQSFKGAVMEQDPKALDTESMSISFDEVINGIDQERESHEGTLALIGGYKGTTTATIITTSEEMESGIASYNNGENSGEWYSSSSNISCCFDDQNWADWDWNEDATVAATTNESVAAEDIHSSSSGSGAIWPEEGEKMLSWLWEDDDGELGVAGTTAEDWEQQQQALADWLLS